MIYDQIEPQGMFQKMDPCAQDPGTVGEKMGWNRAGDEAKLGGSETILLVEDEPFVRNVTCEVLRSAGYTVLAAKNAAEGLAAYRDCPNAVELLLTDVILPGETGTTLAKRLRTEDPELKVLFITGYTEQLKRREIVHEECLAKPFSTGVLLRNVRQLLDRQGAFTGTPSVPGRACGTA